MYVAKTQIASRSASQTIFAGTLITSFLAASLPYSSTLWLCCQQIREDLFIANLHPPHAPRLTIAACERTDQVRAKPPCLSATCKYRISSVVTLTQIYTARICGVLQRKLGRRYEPASGPCKKGCIMFGGIDQESERRRTWQRYYKRDLVLYLRALITDPVSYRLFHNNHSELFGL
ncbi:hypothetical protein BUE80_DR002044, partial [Diplocarpon rosae]